MRQVTLDKVKLCTKHKVRFDVCFNTKKPCVVVPKSCLKYGNQDGDLWFFFTQDNYSNIVFSKIGLHATLIFEGVRKRVCIPYWSVLEVTFH